MAVLGAAEKRHKSNLALGMALDLAEGKPLLAGRFKVSGSRTVLYLEQELGEHRLRDRLAKMMLVRDPQTIARDNFYYSSKDLSLTIDTEGGLTRIAAYLEACHPSVLFLDPWMFFHAQDENDNNRQKALIMRLRGLTEPRHITTVIVHHEGKPGEYRKPGGASSLRGASALAGAADSILMLHRPIENRKDVIEVNFTLRSGEDPPPLTLQFNKETFAMEAYT